MKAVCSSGVDRSDEQARNLLEPGEQVLDGFLGDLDRSSGDVLLVGHCPLPRSQDMMIHPPLFFMLTRHPGSNFACARRS
jgi:hypothetical protein